MLESSIASICGASGSKLEGRSLAGVTSNETSRGMLCKHPSVQPDRLEPGL